MVDNAKLEALLKAETQYELEHRSERVAKAGLLVGDTAARAKGRKVALARAKAAFNQAFEALTPDELQAYGEYRKANR